MYCCTKVFGTLASDSVLGYKYFILINTFFINFDYSNHLIYFTPFQKFNIIFFVTRSEEVAIVLWTSRTV